VSISAEINRWLKQAGFTNDCFISYPHVDEDTTDFARRVRADLEKELKKLVSGARVYLDETHIPPGADWPEHLRQNLCGSATMSKPGVGRPLPGRL
jgi:TIR domain